MGSKINARENFLFNVLFKTPKFELQEKLPAKKNFRPGAVPVPAAVPARKIPDPNHSSTGNEKLSDPDRERKISDRKQYRYLPEKFPTGCPVPTKIRQGAREPGGRDEHMTVGLLHGSKSNARENFLFNGLFKTPKFDLDQKLCCFY